MEHPAPDLSAKARELLQAIAADFIVILQGSPGSIAEVHDFAGFIREIGSKMLIFIDERAQEGYSDTGALHELKTLYNLTLVNWRKETEFFLGTPSLQHHNVVTRHSLSGSRVKNSVSDWLNTSIYQSQNKLKLLFVILP